MCLESLVHLEAVEAVVPRVHLAVVVCLEVLVAVAVVAAAAGVVRRGRVVQQE